jgi:hypothetical protein
MTETKGTVKPERPTPLPVIDVNIPAELAALPQWVCWTYTWRPSRRKWDKPPLRARDGGPASTTDPTTWTTFAEAVAAYRDRSRGFDGIGFVPRPEDGLVGIDLDDCRDPETGALAPWAEEIVGAINTYTEVSPSGTGLRLIARGRKPGRRCKTQVGGGIVEIYDGLTKAGKPGGRYLTFTGHRCPDAPADIRDRQHQVDDLYARLFASRHTAVGSGTPRAPGGGRRLTDDEIIRRAASAENGQKFRRLYFEGSTADYGGDTSRADAALAALLLFWCGGDLAAAERLMRASALRRPKWDERRGQTTWLRATLEAAAGVVTEFYEPRARLRLKPAPGKAGAEPEGPPADDRPTEADGPPGTGHDLILRYFRDYYRPVFRRGAAIYSQALGREVKPGEATAGAPIDLIRALAGAADAPADKNGVKMHALPAFFATWGKVAWATLHRSLPDEAAAEEVCETAEEEFRAAVSAALHAQVTLGEVVFPAAGLRAGADLPRVERRSLIDWCVRFARAGPWRSIRSYAIWSRVAPSGDGGPRLEVAFRTELFSQVKYQPLAGLTQNQLGRLCEQYRVGTQDRAKGQRCVVLDHDFLIEVCRAPGADPAGNHGPDKSEEI